MAVDTNHMLRGFLFDLELGEDIGSVYGDVSLGAAKRRRR